MYGSRFSADSCPGFPDLLLNPSHKALASLKFTWSRTAMDHDQFICLLTHNSICKGKGILVKVTLHDVRANLSQTHGE